MFNSFQYTKAILLDTSLKLSTEEKYFLIRLVDTYGYEKLKTNYFVDKTINELEELLGMSDYLIAKTRDSLIEKGYLIEPEIVGYTKVSRGRPRVRFAFATLIVSMINKLSKHKIEDDHAQRIESLLLWSDKGESHKELTPSNRILLAVLYAHANPCGAVYNLGVMQMAKLSGLKTRDRTEGQLEKLIKLGFILDRVSGISTKMIWKSSSTGALFLNVLNDNLIKHENENTKKTVNAACLLLMNNDGIFGYQGERMSRRICASIRSVGEDDDTSIIEDLEGIELFETTCKLFSYKESACDDKLSNRPSWDDNIREDDCEWMFQRKFIDALSFVLNDFKRHWYLENFIDYKINYYASLLLTKYWDNIQPKMSLIKEVLILLREDVLQAKFREKLLKDNPRAETYLSVFEVYLYRIIFETALLTKGLIRKVFLDIDEKELSKSNYEILLCPYSKFSFITQYGLIIKLNQEGNDIKAITLNVRYLNRPNNPRRDLKKYSDYSFIHLNPWSLFGLNICN